MLYESLVTDNKDAFLAKVADISTKLGINPDWLMIVMQMESQIDSGAVNRYTNATGLIQFMPSTAAGLGTSTDELLQMSNVDQLDYVYAYFRPYAYRLNSVTDLYAVTFFPRALGKSDDYVFETDTLEASTIAAENPVFDLNGDGQITYGEFKAAILARVPSEALAYLKKN